MLAIKFYIISLDCLCSIKRFSLTHSLEILTFLQAHTSNQAKLIKKNSIRVFSVYAHNGQTFTEILGDFQLLPSDFSQFQCIRNIKMPTVVHDDVYCLNSTHFNSHLPIKFYIQFQKTAKHEQKMSDSKCKLPENIVINLMKLS